MIRLTLLAATLLAAVPAHHAAAQTYRYKSLKYKADFNGSEGDINASGTIVGGYFKTGAALRHCWIFDGKTKTKTALKDPDAHGVTECWGINDAGTIVGDYNDKSGILHGYVESGGTFTTIDPPGTTKTIVYGVSNAGLMGGYFLDASGTQHGFLYDGTTYTTVDVKKDTNALVFGLNASGAYTLEATDSSGISVSYLVSSGTMTPILFPGATGGTAAHHLTDTGLISATWIDASNNYHAGVFDSVANAYYDLDYPGATITIGDGVNVHMAVVGRYQNAAGKSVGYVAYGKLTPHK